MIPVRIKKGYNIPIEGEPSNDLYVLEKPSHVAALPDRIPFVKPRLLVRKGDAVRVGTPLFEDKRNPDLKFASPGGGEVVRIEFGARRVIREIVIRLDEKEKSETFQTMTDAALDAANRDDLAKSMLAGGVWPFIKSLPFRDIANPGDKPPALFVSLGSQEPFQPDPAVYLKEEMDLFRFGVRILKKFTEKVHVIAPGSAPFLNKELKGLATHASYGAYPANDPGVVLYHIKKSASENRSWCVDGQDVLHLARFFKGGVHPVERIMVLAGSMASEKKHFKTRAGIPLKHLTGGTMSYYAPARYITGGVFRGGDAPGDSYMGLFENSLTLIEDGGKEEPFGFVRPGFEKPSFSRTFMSWFNVSDLNFDSGLHGEERACINCGFCARVCPVEILPQFT
ncbi:MAG: hypothetical protein GY859_28910, partial [Desulfobacterales bacterium]|nr:hypothetical protein [Desulfobacterales bacterium]